jgi:hypothetical protein
MQTTPPDAHVDPLTRAVALSESIQLTLEPLLVLAFCVSPPHPGSTAAIIHQH